MEWSRSRYWLCHFLNSRRQRPAIDWNHVESPPHATDSPSNVSALRSWLGQRWPGDDLGDERFIAAAARSYADDPAYVQSLRLLAKERQHWSRLLQRLRDTHAQPDPAASLTRRYASAAALRITRRLGPRFELSILMLTAMVHQRLIATLAAPQQNPSPAATAIDIIQREQADHLAFYIERLTLELADLNFIRRSLRRLRLRLLFAGSLADTAHRHAALLRGAGVYRARFMIDAWRHFEAALARVVPYRRRELIAALLDQRQRPYAPAPRG